MAVGLRWMDLERWRAMDQMINRWTMAHYLHPIAIHHFLITASDGQDVSTSPIYQNQGLPTTANAGPTGF